MASDPRLHTCCISQLNYSAWSPCRICDLAVLSSGRLALTESQGLPSSVRASPRPRMLVPLSTMMRCGRRSPERFSASRRPNTLRSAGDWTDQAAKVFPQGAAKVGFRTPLPRQGLSPRPRLLRPAVLCATCMPAHQEYCLPWRSRRLRFHEVGQATAKSLPLRTAKRGSCDDEQGVDAAVSIGHCHHRCEPMS